MYLCGGNGVRVRAALVCIVTEVYKCELGRDVFYRIQMGIPSNLVRFNQSLKLYTIGT